MTSVEQILRRDSSCKALVPSRSYDNMVASHGLYLKAGMMKT